jgi:hypothetical protein
MLHIALVIACLKMKIVLNEFTCLCALDVNEQLVNVALASWLLDKLECLLRNPISGFAFSVQSNQCRKNWHIGHCTKRYFVPNYSCRRCFMHHC